MKCGLVALAVVLAVWSCSDASTELLVDAKTDLIPGVEFVQIDTDLYRGQVGPGAPLRQTQTGVLVTDEPGIGKRAAEFAGLDAGRYQVRVRLLRKEDESLWCTGANGNGQVGVSSPERLYAFTRVEFEP